MPTFKVVVIGASGVGKTSLRGQYISSRFSTSYRATIGADFITKTLPPSPSSPPGTEPVRRFFRGADAAVLMYDLTTPDTLYALRKWWAEFCDKAPVGEEELRRGFCVVVVGNKLDLVEGVESEVSPAQGARFVRALVPRPDTPPPEAGPSRTLPPLTLSESTSDDEDEDNSLASSQMTARPPTHPVSSQPTHPPSPISILRHPQLSTPTQKSHRSSLSFSHLAKPASGSRASSHSRYFDTGRASTITSTLTIYHTPSSSVFSDGVSEYYHSAQSSFHEGASEMHDAVNGNGNGAVANGVDEHLRARSPSTSARSASEATITPARFSASSSSSTSNSNSSTDSLALADNIPAAHSRDASSSSSQTSTNATSPAPSKPTSPPAPGPIAIDTSSPGLFASRKASPEDASANGPSSSALSPLPYPQHFPFGARALSLPSGANGFAAFAAPPTTAVAREGAGSSVESLPGAFPGVINGGPSANGLVNSAPAGEEEDDSTPTSSTLQTPAPASVLAAAQPKWLAEPELLAVGGSGAAHFRVSARTGAGVSEVFDWVARRLVVLAERREGEMGVEDDPRASVSWGSGRRWGGMYKHGSQGGSRGGAEERLRLNANGGQAAPMAGCC
ncbi:hypothetical protein C8R46DRAFT_1262701 [Mycena filopes]|nr:hypothetical protein C8R46DRAFT_1262701 [Mycena filopes]